MIHDTEINYYLYLPESLHQEADRLIHYLKHFPFETPECCPKCGHKSFRVDNRASKRDKTIKTTRLTPSLDTRNWFHRIEFTGGAAHVNLRAPTLQKNLALLIHNSGGTIRVAGRVCKMVGDVGEEILAQRIMREYHVKAENILGYSRGKLGLNNASGQGLDILVRVPPPPSLTVRTPTSQAARNGIEGAHGTTKTTMLTFQPDTLLVIELKTTLGGQVTPGLSKATQQGGGEKDLKRILKLINDRKSGWDPAKLRAFDPEFNNKRLAIQRATENERIEFVHAQVFLRRDGTINADVGNGSGIQWNSWK